MRNQSGRDDAAANVFRAAIDPRNAREVDRNLAMLTNFRVEFPDSATLIDRMFLDELSRMRAGLEAAQMAQTQIREEIELLLSPPYFPAIFLGRTEQGLEPQALVRVGSELRAVSFCENDPDDFQDGDEVLLSRERNFIHSKIDGGALTCGETATFVRAVGRGRLVIQSREEELVVLAAAPLRDNVLHHGDLIRFDRNTWVAHEKIEHPRGEQYFLEETPTETFDDIGGLDKEVEELKRSIELHFRHSATVSKYRLPRKKSVLLHGSPGTGKTLMARALANWLASISGTGRSRFINIKPGALHSMWYGQSQANYREVFRVAREAGAAENSAVPVVMFFDEVDSIGQVRGRTVHRIDDSVLNAFMAELNGLEERGNILVVAATNVLGTLDPAITRPGRLGDVVLRIPRPGRKAGRQIFEKHLPPDIPYAGNGSTAGQVRAELIDAAVSAIFSAAGADLAHIMFRDGKRYPVRPPDLINGAGIGAMARAAIERACVREARGAEGGLQLADILAAIGDYFRSAASALAPHNCHNYLEDLPQDVDVVRVDIVVRKVTQPYRYLNAA